MKQVLAIAVISDIHSNLDALKTVASKLPSHDELYCLGDLVGYGPQPNEVIEELRRMKPDVVLMGNHDYAVVSGDTSWFSPHAAEAVEWTRRHVTSQNYQYLSNLQPSAKVERAGVQVALYHASPNDPLSEYIYPGLPERYVNDLIQKAGSDLVLLGHTHVPMVYSLKRKLLANPGSVGQPRDGDPRASYAILTLSSNGFSFDIKRVQYDIDSAAGKIVKAGLPSFLAERLYTGV